MECYLRNDMIVNINKLILFILLGIHIFGYAGAGNDAAKVKIEMTPDVAWCDAALVGEIVFAVTDSKGQRVGYQGQRVGYLGTLRQLTYLLKKSGNSDHIVMLVRNMIAYIISVAPTSKSSALRYAAETYSNGLLQDGDQTTGLQVALCILGKNCKSKHGGASHASISPDREIFDIVPFQKPNEWDPNHWAQVTSLDGNKPQRIIVLDNNPEDIPHLWVKKFFGMLSRQSSFELITYWIKANESRLNAKKEPDSLFLRYVRKNGDRWELDEGFLRVFLQACAADTEAEAFESLLLRQGLPLNQVAQFRGFDRENVWRDMEQFGDITKRVIIDEGITAENALDAGNRILEKMVETIRHP